jgi:hypothetical protein
LLFKRGKCKHRVVPSYRERCEAESFFAKPVDCQLGRVPSFELFIDHELVVPDALRNAAGTGDAENPSKVPRRKSSIQMRRMAKTGVWVEHILKPIFNSAIYQVIDRQ